MDFSRFPVFLIQPPNLTLSPVLIRVYSCAFAVEELSSKFEFQNYRER
jgi:hypothetical protein